MMEKDNFYDNDVNYDAHKKKELFGKIHSKKCHFDVKPNLK